jgi:hypothetical protein
VRAASGGCNRRIAAAAVRAARRKSGGGGTFGVVGSLGAWLGSHLIIAGSTPIWLHVIAISRP